MCWPFPLVVAAFLSHLLLSDTWATVWPKIFELKCRFWTDTVFVENLKFFFGVSAGVVMSWSGNNGDLYLDVLWPYPASLPVVMTVIRGIRGHFSASIHVHQHTFFYLVHLGTHFIERTLIFGGPSLSPWSGFGRARRCGEWRRCSSSEAKKWSGGSTLVASTMVVSKVLEVVRNKVLLGAPTSPMVGTRSCGDRCATTSSFTNAGFRRCRWWQGRWDVGAEAFQPRRNILGEDGHYFTLGVGVVRSAVCYHGHLYHLSLGVAPSGPSLERVVWSDKGWRLWSPMFGGMSPHRVGTYRLPFYSRSYVRIGGSWHGCQIWEYIPYVSTFMVPALNLFPCVPWVLLPLVCTCA